MRNWNLTKDGLPDEYIFVEVKDSTGNVNKCRIVYLDDIGQFIWEDEKGSIYAIEFYEYWNEINHKKYKNRFPMKIFNKVKKLFSKKYWVVTCITEDLEIFSQDVFKTYDEAYDYMSKEYSKIGKNLEKEIVDSNIFKESATIIYSNEPLEFEWKITCIIK